MSNGKYTMIASSFEELLNIYTIRACLERSYIKTCMCQQRLHKPCRQASYANMQQLRIGLVLCRLL